MAKLTITELPAEDQLTYDHEVPAMSEGETTKLTMRQIADFTSSDASIFPHDNAERNQDGSYDPEDVDVLDSVSNRLRFDGREVLLNRPVKWQVGVANDFQADANPDHESDAGGFPDQVQIATDIFAEMKTYHPHMSHLIIGGDLKDRWPPSLAEQAADTVPRQTAQDFVEIMEASGIPHVSPIPGNHDRDYREYADRDVAGEGDPFFNYKKYFQKSFYYEIWGNNLFIYLGDMGGGIIHSDGGTHGIIPDYVFDWYKTVVENHMGFNKFVFSHQWIHGTGAGTSSDPLSDQFIRGWDRFTNHMVNYPISLWAAGHTMGDTATDVNDMHSVAYNGCLFVNAGLHISGHAETAVTDLTYVLLDFEDNSDQLEVTRWDHIAKDFVSLGAVSVTLPFKARLSSLPIHDGRNNLSAYDPIEGKRTSTRSIELNADGTVWGGPYWVTDRIVDDRLGVNIPAFLEVGQLLQIPGGLDSDPNNLVHNYGFGAAWTAQKVSSSDDDYSTDFVGYASNSGKDEASLVEVFRGSDGKFSVTGKLHATVGLTNLVGLFESSDAGASITLIDDSTTGGEVAEHGLNTVGDQLEVRAVNNIALETNGQERARMSAQGDFLVGKTASNIADVGVELRDGGVMTVTTDGGPSLFLNQTGADGTMQVFRNDNSTIGTISNDGTSVSYNTTSDYRLKKDVKGVTDAISRVRNLNPVNFEWVVSGRRVDGFIAHEVQEVVPDAVTGEKDGVNEKNEPVHQVMDHSKLVPILTAALQESLNRIDQLEERISILEN